MARPYAMLRGLMQQNGETQTDLCRLLLLSRSALSERFNNLTDWKLGEMYAIMIHYRVPSDRLHMVFPMNGKNEV